MRFVGVVVWIGLGVISLGGCAAPQAHVIDATLAATFDDDDVNGGRLPAGWRAAATNPTAGLASWSVQRDLSAPTAPHVLALTRSDNYDGTFNLALAERTSFRDLDLSVAVKSVAGREDQGGGPLWRCQDENNYYICRLNPLESNFRVYVVKDGKRKQLDSFKVELITGQWYTIRVTMVGDQIECYLDGAKHLSVADASLPNAGQVGLWTKADAVTSFDDLWVSTLEPGAAPPSPTPAHSSH